MPETETGRVTMNWPLELKEAVRERVGGRGLTPFVISAVEAKLGTHDEHQADSKELNEVRFLAQRLADTIAMRSDYEDPESTLREIDLPPWIDTTGWPEELARAINPEESTPEPVEPERELVQATEMGSEAWAAEEAREAAEARIPDDFQPVGMVGDDGGVFSKGQDDHPLAPGVGDIVLNESPKTSHSNDLFKRLTAKAAEKGVDVSGIDLKPASSIERPEVKTLTAEEAGFKLEAVEEESAPEPEVAPAVNAHNHAWSRFEAEGYEGQPYFCACGATMDSKRVYPDGKPQVQVPIEVAVPLEVPAEEPTPVAGSDVCPKCQSELVAGECWECF